MLADDITQTSSVSNSHRWWLWIGGILLFFLPFAWWPLAQAEEVRNWQPTGRDVGGLVGATFASDQGLTTIYRWSSAGLWRSVDEGRTWTPIGEGLPATATGGITLHTLEPGGARTVYALAGEESRRGLYRSVDSGATFELLHRPQDFNPSLLAAHAQPDGDWLIMADAEYLSWSEDGGVTWESRQMAGHVSVVHVDDGFWAGGTGWLMVTQEDDWQTLALPDGVTPRRLISPVRNPDQLYILHDQGLLRGATSGDDWETVLLPDSRRITGLAIDPLVWQTLMAGDSVGGIWRSDDWGLTWVRLPSPTEGMVDFLFLAPEDREQTFCHIRIRPMVDFAVAPRTDAYPDADTDSDRYGHADQHTDVHIHANGHRYAHTHTHSDVNVNANPHSHSHTDNTTHRDSDINTQASSLPFPITHRHAVALHTGANANIILSHFGTNAQAHRYARS